MINRYLYKMTLFHQKYSQKLHTKPAHLVHNAIKSIWNQIPDNLDEFPFI